MKFSHAARPTRLRFVLLAAVLAVAGLLASLADKSLVQIHPEPDFCRLGELRRQIVQRRTGRVDPALIGLSDDQIPSEVGLVWMRGAGVACLLLCGRPRLVL